MSSVFLVIQYNSACAYCCNDYLLVTCTVQLPVLYMYCYYHYHVYHLPSKTQEYFDCHWPESVLGSFNIVESITLLTCISDNTAQLNNDYGPPPGYTVGGANAFLPYSLEPRNGVTTQRYFNLCITANWLNSLLTIFYIYSVYITSITNMPIKKHNYSC